LEDVILKRYPDSKYFVAHPYSTPAKIHRPKPSTMPTNTVKYPLLGD
jgi:hypothetical protein